MTRSPMTICGYDGVELWVGNAKQAAHVYRCVFGFRLTAYAGPETGLRDRASYVLEQGELRFVFTSGLRPDHDVVRQQALHGDGIHDVAFEVTDAAQAHTAAVERGARTACEPEQREDAHGVVVVSAIETYGDTIHSFVQRDRYSGPYLPGYEPVDAPVLAPPVGLTAIDHVVGNVEVGAMEDWALMSKVLWDGVGNVKVPINEPAEGRRRSQIEEYLDAYGGPGVQHLALATDDLVSTVRALRRRGLGFLVDRDDEGYLLQIFTEPLQDRPTVFFELIQREGATGFGVGNFKALFEALERAQRDRGNL